MKSFIFKPSVCKETEGADGVKVQPTYEGQIELFVPSFDQRFQYIEEAGFEVKENGEVDAGVKNIKSIRKIVGLSEKHYKSVFLKNIETGEEFKSFSDISFNPDLANVMIEVAAALLNGLKVSKN